MNEVKQSPPASVRNMPPLRDVLARFLGPATLPEGVVLEIASGSGYHAAAFAGAFPHLTWQPTDPDAKARASITAHIADEDLPNIAAPLELDVRSEDWPITSAAAMVCINMIHISPWDATVGLMRGAGRTLRSRGVLITYGPYAFDGVLTPESNKDFDQSLKTRDPSWGIRDVRDITDVARENGLGREETIAMPANNHVLVFRKV